jgi:hypothetical protein
MKSVTLAYSEASFVSRYFRLAAANYQLGLFLSPDLYSVEPVLLDKYRTVWCVHFEPVEDCVDSFDPNDGGAFCDFELSA